MIFRTRVLSSRSWIVLNPVHDRRIVACPKFYDHLVVHKPQLFFFSFSRMMRYIWIQQFLQHVVKKTFFPEELALFLLSPNFCLFLLFFPDNLIATFSILLQYSFFYVFGHLYFISLFYLVLCILFLIISQVIASFILFLKVW